MREITIIREKKFVASLAAAFIALDGKVVAKVKNGQTVKISVDDEAHEIAVYANQINGNTLRINADSDDIILNLSYNFSGFKLTNDSVEEDLMESINEELKQNKLEESKTKSYVCASIISFGLLIFSIVLFGNNTATTMGFLFGVIFSLLTGVTMIMGGFWIVIIPLPYIAIWKAGCVRPNQSMLRKIGLGFLTFVFVILVFVALYTF